MARTTVDTTVENGIVQEDFSVILSRAFATYGLSVVTDRALPDARDGLKPVQRRILTGMLQARYLSSRPTVKSAEVVGLILGNYHPHGDSSVYEAAVRMSQPFTMRYPLIEGQGNMGSEDGDAPAAYLSIAEMLLLLTAILRCGSPHSQKHSWQTWSVIQCRFILPTSKIQKLWSLTTCPGAFLPLLIRRVVLQWASLLIFLLII